MTNPVLHSIVCDGLCCQKKNTITQDGRKVCKLYAVVTHLNDESKLIELATKKEIKNWRIPCLVNMPPPAPIIIANVEDD